MRAGWNKLFSVFRCFFLGNNTISYYTGDAAKLISSSQFFDYITYVILIYLLYINFVMLIRETKCTDVLTVQDAMKTTLLSGGHPLGVNQEQKLLTNPATIKPALPPISIKKPESRWTLATDTGSGFTFPVSASTSVFSEPPTPSITPLLSARDQHQLKEGSTELSYSFGLKKSSPAVVFSFPSTSNTAIQNEAGDIKFNFGSTKKPRLSFSFGKNAVCC